jgi:hypothetical protein
VKVFVSLFGRILRKEAARLSNRFWGAGVNIIVLWNTISVDAKGAVDARSTFLVYDLTGSTLAVGSANLNQCSSLMTKSPACPRMNGLR